MSVEYEIDASREEAGSVLRRLGDGVVAGSVRLGDDADDGDDSDDGVTVALPERVELEIEYESGDEPELEVELEWDAEDVAGPSSRRDATHDEPTGTDGEGRTGAEHASGSESDEGADSGDLVDVGSEERAASEEDAADSPVGTEIVAPADDGGGSKANFELFRDRADEWRWRLVHDNGNVIADSGEGYDRKAGARNGIESVMANAPGADVIETD